MIWNQNETIGDYVLLDKDASFRKSLMILKNQRLKREKLNKSSSNQKGHWNSVKIKDCNKNDSNNQIRTPDVTSPQQYVKVDTQNLEAAGKQIIRTQTQARRRSSQLTSPSDLKPNTNNTMNDSLKEGDTGATSREERKLQYYMKLIQRREKEEVKKKTRKSIKKTCNQEPNTTKGRRGRKRKNIQKPEWISTNEVLDDLKLELVTDDSEFPVELFQRDQPSTCEVSNLNLSAIHPPLTQIWGKTLTKERENTFIASIPSSSLLRAKEGDTLSKESSPLSLQTHNPTEAASCFKTPIPVETESNKPTLKDQFVSSLLERTKAMQIQAAQKRTVQPEASEGLLSSPTATFKHFNGLNCPQVRKYSNSISDGSIKKDLDDFADSNIEMQKLSSQDLDTYCKPYEKDVEMQSQITTTQGADQEEDTYLGSPLSTEYIGTPEIPPAAKLKKRHAKKLFKIVRFQRDALTA